MKHEKKKIKMLNVKNDKNRKINMKNTFGHYLSNDHIN